MNLKIFVIFYACTTLALADEDSDEAKYIDLLPEEEKQEFLNRIARRILDDIKSKSSSGKSSVEVSDEKLNEHNDYIQKIFKEESDSLKNQRRTVEYSEVAKTEENESSHLQVKPLEINVSNQELENLPVNENGKRVQKDTMEDEKIPVRLMYDEENDLHDEVKIENIDNIESTAVESPQINDDIEINNTKFTTTNQSKAFENNTRNIILQNENQEGDIQNYSVNANDENMTKIETNSQKSFQRINIPDLENNSEVSETKLSDVDPQTDVSEEGKFSNHNETIERQSKEEKNHNNNMRFTQTIYESTENDTPEIIVSSTFINLNNMTKIILENSTEFNKVTDSMNINNISNFHTTTQSSRSFLEKDEDFKKLSKDLSEKKNSHEESVTYISPATESDFMNPNSNQEVTTLEVKSETVLPSVEKGSNYSNKKTDNNYDVTNKDNAANDFDTQPENNSFDYVNFKPSLKQSVLNNDMEKEFDDKLREHFVINKQPQLLDRNMKSNENYYKVYEDPKDYPPVEPFTKKNDLKQMNEPQYVAIYNYDPSNAYYSAYNHLGPNFDETAEFDQKNNNRNHFYNSPFLNLNKLSEKDKGRVSGHRNFKFRSKNDGMFEQVSKVRQPPKTKLEFSKIYFNPYDYLDMDYYLGRANDVRGSMNNVNHENSQRELQQDKSSIESFADSLDYDPVIDKNSIKKSISNIRKLLGFQNHEVTKERLKNKTQIKIFKSDAPKSSRPLFFKATDKDYFNGLSQDIRTHDVIIDKSNINNIAVDYYFGRMNSNEESLSIEIEPETIKVIKQVKNHHPIKTNKVKTTPRREKTDTYNHGIVEEEHFGIPLSNITTLLINVTLKDDNNVDVVFKKVKDPERNNESNKWDAYIKVMKDMIDDNNENLKKYNWLHSSVDIQSAMKKLSDLSNHLSQGHDVHPSDLELFKYILFLHKSASITMENDIMEERSASEGSGVYDRRIKLPRNKKKRRGEKMKKPLEQWKRIYSFLRNSKEVKIDAKDTLLIEFRQFVNDLRSALNEIHEAIKGIAMLTKYNKQTWYRDLKELYLDRANRKDILRLLLHLSAAKLFALIEESAKKGVEDNFALYVTVKEDDVRNTKEEFVFLLRLLNEIRRLDDK